MGPKKQWKYGRRFRNPAFTTWSNGSLSQDSKGFLYLNWLAVSRISSINRSLPRRWAIYCLLHRTNPPAWAVSAVQAKITQNFVSCQIMRRHMSLHFTCNMSFGQQICDVLCILFSVEFCFWFCNWTVSRTFNTTPDRCWLWTAEPLSHVALGGSNGSNGEIKVGVV